MVSFTEFDPQEVAEIQSIASQFGGGGGGGRGPVAKASRKAPPILTAIIREANAELRRNEKSEKLLRRTALKEGKAAEKALTKENKERDATLKQKVQDEIAERRASGLRRTGRRITESVGAATKGALIAALPPEAARVGLAAFEGFRAAGIIGGVAGAAGAGGAIIFREIARRNEEQQEAIRQARGFETLAARKRRLLAITPTISRLPAQLILHPVDNAARIIEQSQLFIQENVKAPLAGAARRFEVAPGLEAAYDTIRLGLPLLNRFTDSPITNALGIEINFSAQDILPSIPEERFHRETDIAKWQSLPVNAHPVAATIMNEMRRRIDSQIAGTGVAGGWKVEPVFGD